MNAPLIVVPFAIELTVLVTTIAPPALAGRFDRRPNLGIAIWLFGFLIAFLSTLMALVVAIWSVFDTWRELEANTQPLWHTVVFSLAPWLILGLAGISMAFVAQKLDPVFEARNSDVFSRDLPSVPLLNFHGLDVRIIEVSAWVAFTKGSGLRARTYVSRGVYEGLSSENFEALLWHERAHATHWHNAIKGVVSLIRHLGGIMLASRVLSAEIDRLCELAADVSAGSRVGRATVEQARAHFQ